MQLLDLPEEILSNIIEFLPVADVLRLQSSSRRLFQITSHPLIWRRYCLEQYSRWHPKHGMAERLSGGAASEEWRNLLAVRRQQDAVARRSFETMLLSQQGRIPKIRSVLSLGEDAEDLLHTFMNAPEDTEDVLARRYWANEILGGIRRAQALRTWVEAKQDPRYPIERALAAIDQFVIEDAPETIDQVTEHLDNIADDFRETEPEHEAMSCRDKAVALAEFLIQRNLTGMPDHDKLRDIQNALISVALCDPEHPSLPVISGAIFCAVARRIGVEAHICNFPFHAIVTVKASGTKDLDGHPLAYSQEDEWHPTRTMFMDPFKNSSEIRIDDLLARLTRMTPAGRPRNNAAAGGRHREELRPASTGDIMHRMAHNLQQTISEHGHRYTTALQTSTAQHLPASVKGVSPAVLNPYRAAYCTWWLQILFAGGTANVFVLHTALQSFAEDFSSHFKEIDSVLVETYMLPVFADGSERMFLLDLLRHIAEDDSRLKQPRIRGDAAIQAKVRYRVGDIFVHKRYGYQAAITGWDPICTANAQWVATMQVNALSRGQDQPFYHVLAQDQSTRYVADDNVQLVTESSEPSLANFTPDEGLMRVAGRHFKRFDRAAGRFISNVQDQYPHD